MRFTLLARMAVLGLSAGALVLPAGASAASLGGQLIGATAASGKTKLTVPVLLSNASARKAKLRSMVAVLVISKKAVVGKSGKTKLLAPSLQWGDTIAATGKITKAMQKSTLPAIPVTKLSIKKHATSRTDSILSQRIKDLTAALLKLKNYVSTLAAYTIAQFASVRADIADIRANMLTMNNALTALQTQVKNLNVPPDLSGQLADLAAKVAGLQTGMTTLQTRITTVESTLGSLTPQQLTDALADIGTLKSLTQGLSGTGTIASQLSTISSQLGAVPGGQNVEAQIAALTSSLTTAQGQISALCTSNILTSSTLITLIPVGHAVCP